MPVFNGGLQSYADVASDLVVNVKVDGKWVDIDKFDKFKYNSNWGNWNDGGFSGYWLNYLKLQKFNWHLNLTAM